MTTTAGAIQELGLEYARAWSSRYPEAVASFFAPEAEIRINGGDIYKGRAAIAHMVAGFYAAFPDLVVRCNDIRAADGHAIFVWTLEGHHAETKKFVRVGGWEEWQLDENLKVRSSLGWFDAAEYQRQISEGA